MDTAVVVLVLILVVGLFGFISYLLVREVGWQRARTLVIAPIVGATAALPATTLRARRQAGASDIAGLDLAQSDALPQIPAVTDEQLRTLREEIQGELVRATGVSRDFDARLTKIEGLLGDSRRSPDDVEAAIREVEERHIATTEKLHREMGLVQRTASTFGERRIGAVSELYGHLARVEAALASVVNPALLPGEPLSLPAEIGADAFVWANWREVGDRSFAFGDAFNQHRYVLEDDTAVAVETFITTLRQALTGAVYPNVQAPNPGQVQRSQVRTGLGQIIAALPDIRRKLELAYRADAI